MYILPFFSKHEVTVNFVWMRLHFVSWESHLPASHAGSDVHSTLQTRDIHERTWDTLVYNTLHMLTHERNRVWSDVLCAFAYRMVFCWVGLFFRMRNVVAEFRRLHLLFHAYLIHIQYEDGIGLLIVASIDLMWMSGLNELNSNNLHSQKLYLFLSVN